ncbi:MAG: transposase, partial [Pirellula sp.]|nr:transposase [Pirellula sp.]
GGTLLGDCYAGFESLQVARNHEFDLAACNAHARRKLSECMQDHPKESAALLAIYRQLYDVESSIKGLPCEEIVAKRQKFSLPLFERMKQLIVSLRQCGDILPKSKLGKAIGYLENNWEQLTHYLCKGDCPIDNNECEQLMKHTATGRKNWAYCNGT